jgi:YVTN family beta-propeller protein
MPKELIIARLTSKPHSEAPSLAPLSCRSRSTAVLHPSASRSRSFPWQLLLLVAIGFLFGSTPSFAQTPFSRTYHLNGNIEVSCCTNGESYGFTSLVQDTTLSGPLKITSISVSDSGNIITTDPNGVAGTTWEIFVGNSSCGFPVGQFNNGSIQVGTYTCGAATQLIFNTNGTFTAPTSGAFAGSYNFQSAQLTTNDLGQFVSASNNPTSLSSGLYVQVLLWGGDVGADLKLSNISLTVTGTIGSASATAPLITTVAGGPVNNIPALSVALGYPQAVFKDTSGNLYIATQSSSGFAGGIIYKVDPTGNVTTVAGNDSFDYTYNGNNGDGGLATNASLGSVSGIFVDAQNNIYFSEYYTNTIRKINSAGILSTVAGGGAGCGNSSPIGDGCAATSAILSDPQQIFVDSNHNIFFADLGNNRVREVVAATSLIKTVAGGGSNCTGSNAVGDGCQATSATLLSPAGVTLDSHGNIFISDSGNDRIREVTISTGIISTFAGNGNSGFSGDGAAATSAQIANPEGLSFDSNGNLFFADAGNLRVREVVASTGFIQTLAGGGFGCSPNGDFYGNGCAASNAIFFDPLDVFVDSSNNLFVVDEGQFTVREIMPTGGVLSSADTIQIAVGNGTYDFSGDGLPATNAQIGLPFGIAVDSSSNYYIADLDNDRVREVDALTGIISTVAGGSVNSVCGGSTDSYGDNCPATQALVYPLQVFVDASGNIFISDDGTNSIREVSKSTGKITIVVGGGSGCGNNSPVGDNCPALDAILSTPWGLFVDSSGNIFFSDYGNSRIREFNASTGQVQTIAGTGVAGYNGDNIPAVQAQISSPTGLYADPQGNIYFSDTSNYRVREIVASTGNIITVAGTGTPGYNGDNILATTAEIGIPYGIFVDHSGNIFFGDQINNRVREVVASNGLIQTVAGNGTIGFSGDGSAAISAELAYPESVATDKDGNLYIADTYNNRIREVFSAVLGNTLAISTQSLPNATVGTSYSYGLQATGGVPPYTWSLVGGALPAGFSPLSSAGVISGTPLTSNSYGFTVRVTDSAANSLLQSFNILVNPAVATTASATIQPSSLSFSSQIVSTTSYYQAVSITSNGTTAFLISSIAISGTNAGDFFQTNTCPIGGAGLAPGDSCFVYVNFTPSATGARAANLVITDNQGNIPGTQQSIPLSGTGVDVAPVASTTYTITGNPFTSFTGAVACPPDCNFSGYFTVAQPLAPNLSNISISPSDWSASVGTTVFNHADTTGANFASISTDSNGNIISWSISLFTANASISTINTPSGASDTFSQVSPQGTASNSGAPATWPKTTVTPLTFPVSATPVTNVATVNCPSNTNPCTDPNAHSFKLTVPAVNTAFTLTVTSFEVPASQANGICPAGQTEATNFNCRFVDYFAIKTNPNGDVVVPQCIPYSSGNCVFYRISNTPPSTYYTNGIDETIAWNNTSFVPSSTYNATNPRVFDDPDSPPYDVNHQFVFDITDYFVSSGSLVGDPALHSHTKQYNDFVAAYPAAVTGTYVANILSPVGTPSFLAGANVPVNFSLTLNGAYTGSAITAPNAVSVGVINSSGARQPVLTTGGVAPVFVYNASVTPPQYQLVFSTTGYAPGTYTVYISSNLFPQQTQNFVVTAAPTATLVSIAVTPVAPTLASGTSQQFVATGTYSDGSTQDITGSVTWSSATTSVATVSVSGYVTAQSVGTSNITAALGNIASSTLLTVNSHLYTYIGSSVSATCCLDVFDTSTNQLVTSIPVTTLAEPIGVTPNQTRLYLADYTNNIVDVVDATTNTLMTSFAVAGGPNAVAISPKGNFGYVGNAANSSVSVFNVATNTVTANIPVGFSVTDLAVTPDGSLVYATGTGNSVAVISAATNTVVSTFAVAPPAGQPTAGCLGGPLFNSSGTLAYYLQSCVGNTVSSSVTVLSLPGNTLVANIPVGITPYDLSLTPDGSRLYVVNANSNNVSVINTTTNQVIATVPVGSAPQSIKVTPDGTSVYVANTKSNTVSTIQTSTNTVTSTFDITVPFGIAIASPPPASQATTLTLNPTNLVFNTQVIGTTSLGQTITVTNPGSTPVTFTSVSLTGPNASEYSFTDNCPIPPNTLPAGGSCPIVVFFTPFAAGAQTALLTINSTNGLASSQQSAPLSGVGTGSGATIQPASLAFGSQTVSTTSAEQSITITSTGDANFLISSIAVTGVNAGDFLESTNCPINGAGLVPGNSCGIFVTFAPTAIGARTASVVITDNLGNVPGSQQTVPLTGTGADVAPVASTTYNITGNPFTAFTGAVSCPPSCNIAGSFSLASPLAPNLSNASVTPTSYSFSVGTAVITQANSTSASFTVSTDASGNITGWSITVANASYSISTKNINAAASDTFTQVSPQGTASNSGAPSTWPKTTVTPLTFPVSSTPVTNVATINCPSNTNPCTDPNAHSFKLVVPAVSTAFTLTVTTFEVPTSQANGICQAGHTEADDFDCRFVDYFAYQTDAQGNVTVPLCIPYSNGNCVFYRVSNTPPSTYYTPGIQETIAWNNNSFTPPAFYNASNPRVFDDPDSPPYDINHQFVFDITDYFVSSGNLVGDPALHAHTKQYNDFVAAYPAAVTGTYVANILSPVGTPSFAAGANVPVNFSLTLNGSYVGSAITAPNAVSIGVASSTGVRQSVLTTAGVAPVFVYNTNATPPQYQLVFSTTGYAPGTYTLFINSNLFPQQSQNFTITPPSGGTPSVTISPASLAFGNQTVSTTSTEQAITISSTGSAALLISSININGTNAGDFLQSTDCPIGGEGLAVGNSCGIFVSFSPTAIGARTASVVITDNLGNVPGSQQTVPLTGTGADVAPVASTTYNITGNPFTAFTGAVSCPPSCNIAGSFSLASPLAPNLSNASVTPTSYSFSVGTAVITQANATSASFTVSTDASGNITGWSITVANASYSISTKNINAAASDTFTQVSPQGTASNSGAPSTWPKTTVTPLTFPVSSTPVTNVATINCPSNTNPCTDPNAHSFKLVVPAVSTAFTLTVTTFEVPTSQANGICQAGHTEADDFDCRFVDYFAYQTDAQGNVTVPLCIPYSNGNCVFYRVSNTPPSTYYTPGIQETIAWNNNSFTPPAFYNASNPRVFDDPDSPPYDINHQFVFDITDYFVSSGNLVGDPALHAHTKQYNDFVAAYPAAPTSTYVATVLAPVNNPAFAAGSDVPVNFSLTQNGTYTGSAITAPNAVSIGVVNSTGVRQSVLTTAGVAPVFVYNTNATPPQYQLVFSTTGYAPGTYTLFINSNLFPQQSQTFTISSSAAQPGIGPQPTNAFTITKDSNGNYVAAVNLINSGNVTLDSCTLTGGTLGAASLASSSGSCTSLVPGQPFGFKLTFPSSAGADGASVPLKLQGTYTAGTTTGNWGVSFRSATLP